MSPVDEGTPQGGPLSPSVVEHRARRPGPRSLERRGHRFVRYADDSNIYVQQPSGPVQRVMDEHLRPSSRRSSS